MSGGASWIDLAAERATELAQYTGEHILLTSASTGIAIAIGVPLGILAARVRWLRGGLVGAVGILQTIPSLAMLTILLALVGQIGALPAVIALTLYALLPIVRNTLTGIEGVPRATVDAATGIGMTSGQRLKLVKLPLAMPVIVAGIRTAAVVGVGIATLSAFIGGGGLGTFINRGLALNSHSLILLGAIPAAILALIVDGSIASSQWGVQRARTSRTSKQTARDKILRPLAVMAPIVVVLCGGLAFIPDAEPARPPVADSADASPSPVDVGPPVVIGTKNFTEQLILGELMAQMLESRGIPVDREFNLGGTMICHGALENGSVDIYAEYTGTGLTAILKEEVIADPAKALAAVADAYADRFNAQWLAPFGFNNTYAITVTASKARALGLTSITDLAAISGEMTAGFTAEFAERPDGYPGLRASYGLGFDDIVDLDPSLMYQAIVDDQVQVICAFATDGRIAAFDLQPLDDDRGFFPPYQAAPVVRSAVLADRPEVRQLLERLGGRIDDATMQRLNYAVDGEKRSPASVAREFLTDEGLLAPE